MLQKIFCAEDVYVYNRLCANLFVRSFGCLQGIEKERKSANKNGTYKCREEGVSA